MSYKIYNYIYKHAFFRNKIFVVLILFSVLLNFGMWYVIAKPFTNYILQNSANLIPLHYNVYFGIDFFGDLKFLYIIPGVGLLVLLVNSILGLVLYNKSKLLSYYLVLAIFILHLFLGWSLFLIIKFNM